MRILLLGAATVALSGCSWLGGGHHYGHNNYGQSGYYNTAPAEACCDGGNKWNLEVAAGPEFFRDGDIITGDSLAAGAGGTSSDLSFKDVYDPGFRYELGFSKALSPNRKLTIMGHHANADGERIDLGNRSGGALVSGDISDYERYGLEVGLRQYFAPSRAPIVKAIRPYVEGKVGATHVDDIGLTNVTRGGTSVGDVALYEGGWVPSASGMVGVEAPIFKQMTLGLETGIRYTGELDGTDDLATRFGGDFEGANDGGSNWSVPVMLRGRYRF